MSDDKKIAVKPALWAVIQLYLIKARLCDFTEHTSLRVRDQEKAANVSGEKTFVFKILR